MSKVEKERIQLDGLNAAQLEELKKKAESYKFEAEVNRMMKLIINSLYRNKEVRFIIDKMTQSFSSEKLWK